MFYNLGNLIINDHCSCLYRLMLAAGCELDRKKKVPSACLRKFSSSCSQLVLYGHIFRCTHEREASSRCAADWFYHYVRTLRRSTPVFLPKMFKLGAYCTFLFKARFKLWYNDDRMRYAIAKVVWSISNYHILREKMISCLWNDGMWKNTSLWYLFFWGTVSNISFYGQEKAVPGAASCTYVTLLR